MNTAISKRKILVIFHLVQLFLILFISCNRNDNTDLITKKQSLHEIAIDSSLSYNIKSDISKDTLIVNITLFNKSQEPKYIPINNWYIFGKPMTNYPVYGSLFVPKLNEKSYFNLLVFANKKNNFPDNSEYFVTIPLSSFPIIKQLDPGKSVTIRIMIVDSTIPSEFSEKVYIKSQIIYASANDHKKLITILGLDERRIIRENNYFEFTYDLNNAEDCNNFKNPSFGKPYQQFSDSTIYNIDSISPIIENNLFLINFFLFDLIIKKYQYIGFDVGDFIDKTIFEIPRINRYSINPLKLINIKKVYNGRYISIFNFIFLHTYKYSVNIED